MKRILLALACYALYRWWTKPAQGQVAVQPPIALPPPRKREPQRRKPAGQA